MNKVATIILNRNLPEITDALFERFTEYENEITDVFVVEAGSDTDKKSKYTTWSADWDDVIQNGLRFSRGMNFGLSQLWKENRFNQYDAFFLVTNDTVLESKPILPDLLAILHQHQRVGILSPCGENWGERQILKNEETRYFWFIHNNALMLRRKFVESVMNVNKPDFMNFLFDGSNFRGYGAENELIAKAYANDWAAAITSAVTVGENEEHLLNRSQLIKTERYEDNLQLYISEGLEWMKSKYGFSSHWDMQLYVKFFYDNFFVNFPELCEFRI